MSLTPQESPPLARAAGERAARYLEGLDDRPVGVPPEAVAALARLGGPLPERGESAGDVLARLDEVGSPATVATAGGRYFGLVVGGTLPAALRAGILATGWDQVAGLRVASPLGAQLEEIVQDWVLAALDLPREAAVGFVTGATQANLCALLAARHSLLAERGWDVEADGLFGAPPFDVIVGAEVHASVEKALTMAGLGRARVRRVPVDEQGRMRAADFPKLTEPALVILQAGNVNTGAFDPAAELCDRAAASGSWVHVDGAFGLWARATPTLAGLTAGLERADSWAVDGHKWLNVPYDSGLVLCRHPAALRAALTLRASYLMEDGQREPSHFTADMSRRARGVEIWAALRSLGRRGLAELIERSCRQAGRFAQALSADGHEIRNEVVLNQVLVSFGDDGRTDRVIAALQAEGTTWCGGTTWQGRRSMRIAVSSWATTDEDVELSLKAMKRAARSV